MGLPFHVMSSAVQGAAAAGLGECGERAKEKQAAAFTIAALFFLEVLYPTIVKTDAVATSSRT